MNILFSVGELEKDFTAPSKIAFKLAKSLTEKGHRCFIAGICTSDTDREETLQNVRLIRILPSSLIVKSSDMFENFISKRKLIRSEARKKFVLWHPIASILLFFKHSDLYRRMFIDRKYIKEIRQLINDKKIDALICVCKPVKEYELLLESDLNVAKYAYQLDPWGLHCFDNPGMDTSVMCKENKAYSNAVALFTTVPLFKQYQTIKEYADTVKKATPLEFPNIEKYYDKPGVKSYIEFDKKYINILFSGVVTDDFRSPEKILEFLSLLIERSEKIKIFFMGDCYSDSLKNYAAKYPENIIICNHTDIDTAFKTMTCSDILLNINNIIPNQVPSKIFDYFSLGKPIINVQKIENCPSKEYFDKYPLCFTFKEWAPDLAGLESFIKSAKDKGVDFETVKSVYYRCTPEYVSGVIEKVLQNKPGR